MRTLRLVLEYFEYNISYVSMQLNLYWLDHNVELPPSLTDDKDFYSRAISYLQLLGKIKATVIKCLKFIYQDWKWPIYIERFIPFSC